MADAGAEWIGRTVLTNGMIVLTYPRCVMICGPSGACSVVCQDGANADVYFAAALQELDEVA